MSGKETYLSATSRKNRRLHYPSPPALLLDVPHIGSLPPVTQTAEANNDVAIASKDSLAIGSKRDSAPGAVTTDTSNSSTGTLDELPREYAEPVGLSPGTPQAQEAVSCVEDAITALNEKAGVDSGGLVTKAADLQLSPVVSKGTRSTKGDSGSETPEWELLNLSPGSRPHSPRSGGVRSLKSSASNSSLWSWADVEDGRLLEPGGLDAALIDTSHFYFLQADLASAVGTASMPEPPSAFHSPTRSWSLSPPLPPLPPPSLDVPELAASSAEATPSLLLPSVAASVSPSLSSSPKEDITPVPLVALKSPLSPVHEPISESMKLLDEETVLQALVGVGMGAPCPRTADDRLSDKGLQSLVALSGQTASFEVGAPIIGGPSCSLFPEYRHHSVGGGSSMDNKHRHHQTAQQHSWPIPVSAGVTSAMSIGFGSPITEAVFPIVAASEGSGAGWLNVSNNNRSGAENVSAGIEGVGGGVWKGAGHENWPEEAPADWEEEEASKDNGGGGRVRMEGLAGVVDEGIGGPGHQHRHCESTAAVRSSGASSGRGRPSGQVTAAASPADVQRREFWAVVYRAWEKRRDLLLNLKAALEIQKSVLWSLALAGAVLGVMMVGGWHRERSQNRELRLQIKAKDERIGQLMVQVTQLKEALTNRRRVLVLRSVSSRQFSHSH